MPRLISYGRYVRPTLGISADDEVGRSLIGDDAGPGSVGDLEVEIDCDYQLRYAATIAAVTAVSGYVDSQGNIIKLIEKIRFVPPDKAS